MHTENGKDGMQKTIDSFLLNCMAWDLVTNRPVRDHQYLPDIHKLKENLRPHPAAPHVFAAAAAAAAAVQLDKAERSATDKRRAERLVAEIAASEKAAIHTPLSLKGAVWGVLMVAFS